MEDTFRRVPLLRTTPSFQKEFLYLFRHSHPSYFDIHTYPSYGWCEVDNQAQALEF